MQKYLQTDEITTKEAKLLFKVRTEMIEVKQNYKNKYIKKSNESEVNEKALLCPLPWHAIKRFSHLWRMRQQKLDKTK